MIHYKKGYKYQLVCDCPLDTGIYPGRGGVHTDYIDLDENGKLTCHKGYAWDGASGPTFDTPDSMRASLGHDALYQLMRMGLLPPSCRDEADSLLRKICIEDGMNPVRAKLWYMAVRMFAEPYARYGTERGVLIAP
jgi:hypothetical protein